MRSNTTPLHKVGKPFLRWAGGKQSLVSKLLKFIPRDIQERVYNEPFLGAGALFLALRPRSARLADLNPHLIECYRSVKERPDLVAAALRDHARSNSEQHYYSVRALYNRSRFSSAQAARFIYLNRTCFNGIFRVNLEGAFNVPYGYKPSPFFPQLDDLSFASQALSGAQMQAQHFLDSLKQCNHKDFVYLDPPYPPLNGTSFFTHYTLDRFTENDQRLLAAAASAATKRGVLVMMTNADTELIRELYDGWHTRALEVTRYVTCKRIRHKVRELVMTNYEIET